VPSILRNFSAPVKLTTDLSDNDLRFLMVHDSDGFNRWESGQTYALRAINKLIDTGELDKGLLDSLESLLDQAIQGKGDKALLAKALGLPDVQITAQTRDVVDPDAIYNGREKVRDIFSERNRDKLMTVYISNQESGAYGISPTDMARRALKNTVLGYLDDAGVASEQYKKATNMTDRVAALSVLTDHEGEYKDAAFADFYQRFKTYPLVIDKWFSLQAVGVNDNTIVNIQKL
jgi:aminopeptidase N